MIEYLLSTFKKKRWLVGVMVCIAMMYSCEEDVVESRPQLSGDEIVFSVATDSTWQAMGSAASRTLTKENTHFLTTLGEDSLYISMVEEENQSPLFVEKVDSVDSRGASVTSLSQFKLTAFLDVNNTYSEYMKDQEVTRNTSSGECTYTPIKYWPNDKSQSIHFFGYAQSKGEYITPCFEVVKANPEVYKGLFNYTLPTPDPDAANKKDAENQPDLVFAVTPNRNKETGVVELDFQHALSAVVFKIQNIPDAVTVNTISFTYVKSGGECVLQFTEDGIDFAWNTESVSVGTYVQTFGTEFTSTSQPHEITDTDRETCFMMVPHTFSDEAALHINLTRMVDGTPYSVTLTKKLNELCLAWEPNKKYTYILSLPEEVQVNVYDVVDADNKVKSDLEIKNTGLSPIYVRAAIIGNWVLEKKDATTGEVTSYEVVADWQDTDGVFNWGTGGEPNSHTDAVRNWLKGSDGFYYYQLELVPGASVPETDALFNTYTLTGTAPVANAVLDLTIAVQAIQGKDLKVYKDSDEVWPKEILQQLFP